MSAALGPTREERGFIPGSDKLPGDVLIPYWTGGQDTALDVTVINPLQIATVAHAAITPGYALTIAYNRKMRGAEEDSYSLNFLVLDLLTCTYICVLV